MGKLLWNGSTGSLRAESHPSSGRISLCLKARFEEQRDLPSKGLFERVFEESPEAALRNAFGQQGVPGSMREPRGGAV
jgi:hypothetical protein